MPQTAIAADLAQESSYAARLLAADPVLDVREEGGRWYIASRVTGERRESPSDGSPAVSADIDSQVSYLVGRVW